MLKLKLRRPCSDGSLKNFKLRGATLALGGLIATVGLIGCNPGNGGGPLNDIVDSLPTVEAQEKIVFVKAGYHNDPMDTGGEIWIMNPDGSEQKKLTNGPNDRHPSLSLNGNIAFVRDGQLWTMLSDGSDQKQRTDTTGTLTNTPVSDVRNPEWHPDINNRKIVFAAKARFSPPHSIYVLDERNVVAKYTNNGNNQNFNTAVNATDVPGDPTVGNDDFTVPNADDLAPTWSPNGQQIIFASDRQYLRTFGGNVTSPGAQRYWELFRLTIGGTQRRVTAFRSYDVAKPRGNPDWSPNGQQVAFNSLAGSYSKIWMVTATAEKARREQMTQLTTAQGVHDYDPNYSPDSTRIVFLRGDDLHVMRAVPESSGNTPRRIISGAVQPSWGKAFKITAAPTPTPRPAATATPIPAATATPHPTATSGGTQQDANISPQSRTTLKRLSNGGLVDFPNTLVVGDHESNGDRALQGFATYPLTNIPAGAQILSAKLSVLSNQQLYQGNPFSLGSLFVERATSLALNEGSIAGGVQVANSAFSFQQVDVTPLVQQARSQGNNVIFRFRFQQVQNGNGQNDNADLNTGGLEVTYVGR